MSSVANVAIHPSQFSESVRCDLLESLRTRRVNHKFHYDSVKQTQKWFALHEAHSPAHNSPDAAAIYDRAFANASIQIKRRRVHVISLGCGGGQKDTRLLKLLRHAGKEVFYTPCDVSTAMVLVARNAARGVVKEQNCFPLVCDLATTNDLSASLHSNGLANAARLITFFGMIPNFEPQLILPRLASLVRRHDGLLFSANLAPGPDYAAGVKMILPQYDNALTRDWLMTFLLDLGIKNGDGEMTFSIEDGGLGLKRVTARFYFKRKRRILVGSEAFEFRRGETIQLFFSYRYTPKHVQTILRKHGLNILQQWIAKSEEEGVFLCRKK